MLVYASVQKFFLQLILVSAAFLFSFSEKATAQDLEIEFVIMPRMMNTSVCEFILLRAPDIVSNSSLIAIGDIRDLRDLMRRAGVSDVGMDFVINGFNKLLKQIAGVKELQRLSTDLLTNMPGERPLAICMGSQGCQLNPRVFGEGAHAGWMDATTANDNYEVKPILGPFNIYGERAEDWLSENTELKSTDLVILRPFDITTMSGVRTERVGRRLQGTVTRTAIRAYVQYMGQFFREISKFSIMKLISDWVNANMVLITRNKAPDPFFRKFVRMNTYGKLQIDQDFLMTFLASYSVLTRITAETLLMGDYITDQLFLYDFVAMNSRERVHEGLAELQNIVGIQSLRRMGINDDSFLGFSKQHAQIMELTIRSASRYIKH